MNAQPSHSPAAGLTFPAALVAVLPAAAAGSFGTYLVLGDSLGRPGSLAASAVAGGFLVRVILGVMGFDITTTAGVAGLLAGAGLSYAITRVLLDGARSAPVVLPTHGLAAALPSVLLSAWIVQHAATARSRR